MKKICNKYYLSVEGETEKWYFEHLQKLINNKEELPCTVKLYIKINKSIKSRAKAIPAPFKIKAFHICDYESNSDVHTKHFENVLKELKEVKKINKNINYKLGYSKEEVIKMTKSMPSIYGYSIYTLKQKIEDMEKISMYFYSFVYG